MLRDEQLDPENDSNPPAGVDADTNIYVTPGAARPVTIQTSNGTEIRPIPGGPVILSPGVMPVPPVQPGPGSSPIPATAYGAVYNGQGPASPANGQPAQSTPGSAPIAPNGYGTVYTGTTTTTSTANQPGQINPGVVSANGYSGQPQQLNPANGYGTVYTGSTTATTSYNGATQPSQGNTGNSRGYGGANPASPVSGNAGASPGTVTLNNYVQPAQGNQPNGAGNVYGPPQGSPAYAVPYNNGFVSQPNPAAYGPAYAPNAVNPANGYGQPASTNAVSGNPNGYVQSQPPIPANGAGNIYGPSQGNPAYAAPYNNGFVSQPTPAAYGPAYAPNAVNPANGYAQPASTNAAAGNPNGYGQPQPPIPANGAGNIYGPPQGNPAYAAPYNNGFVSQPAPAPYGPAYAPNAVNPANGYAQPASTNAAAGNPNGYGQPQPPIPANGAGNVYGPSQGNPAYAAPYNNGFVSQPAPAPIPAGSYGTVYSGTPYTSAPAPTTPTSSFTAPEQSAQRSLGNVAQNPYTYTYTPSGPIPNNAGQGYTANSTSGPAQGTPNAASTYVPASNPNGAPTYITNYGMPANSQGNVSGENSTAKQKNAPIPADTYGTSDASAGSTNANRNRPIAEDANNVVYESTANDTARRKPRPRSKDAVVDGEQEPIRREPRPRQADAEANYSSQENRSSRSAYNEPETNSSTRTTTTTQDTNPQDYETERLTRKRTTQQTTTKDMGGSKIEKHTHVNWGGIAKGVAAVAAVVIVGVGVYYGAGALTSAAINSPTFGPMIQGVVDFATPLLASARSGLSYAAGYLSGVPDIIGTGFRTLFGIAGSSTAASAASTVPTATTAAAVATPAIAPIAPSVTANAGITSRMAGWLFGSGAALWVADHSLFPTIETTSALNHTQNLVTNTPRTEITTTVETIPEVHVHGDHAAHTAAEMGLQAHELDHLSHHDGHSSVLADTSQHTQHSHTSHSSDDSVSADSASGPDFDVDVDERMLQKIESRGANWRNRTSGSNNFSDILNKSGSYRTAVESNRNGSKNIEPSESYVAELEAADKALGEASRV